MSAVLKPHEMKGITMKTRFFCCLFIIAILLSSCTILKTETVTITPSNTMVSENRDVSGFSAIEFSTIGKINIIQGDTESLNISGPDNIVPEIVTRVSRGTLIIKSKRDIDVIGLTSENALTITIVAKKLTSLTVSGLGDVQIEPFSTPSMAIEMSGTGGVLQNQITTDKIDLTLSGSGGIVVSGKATQAKIDVSGAGSVIAPDLQIQNATVTMSGVGSATLWVTDELNGTISGIGNISYYGSPTTKTNSSSQGSFVPLGSK
jgi:hypothetical protein